jgi:carboxyl-terminal processing protease
LYSRTTRRRQAANANAAAKNVSAQNKYEVDKLENDYSEAIELVEQNYVGDIDYEKATQAAIQGMLFTLDPHSIFFPSNEFRKLKEDQASSFVGIGVQILRHDDGVYVQSVVPNTPAARAGLHYGDRIVAVDGKDARDWSSDEVSRNVRGERGKEVEIKVERVGQPTSLAFKIVRAAVPLPSIRNEFMISPATGYVGLIGGFQQTSDEELRQAFADLKKQGMRQLVLDLRNNPGVTTLRTAGRCNATIRADRFTTITCVTTKLRISKRFSRDNLHRQNPVCRAALTRRHFGPRPAASFTAAAESRRILKRGA